MNKLLIVLLAVCLVSVHAMVKRDAAVETKEETNYLNNIEKQAKELANTVSKQVSETFDPETIKKGFNDALVTLQKALDDLKAKTGGAAEPNKAA